MGTTSKGLRYPEGTDLLRDGDNAIMNLANDIDARLPLADTGWITIITVGGWLHYDANNTTGGSGRAAQYRRLGGVVHLRGIIKNGPIGTPFFNMPVGYRWTARAADDWYQPIAANSAFGFVAGKYSPVGDIAVVGGSNAWCDLTGVYWIADA